MKMLVASEREQLPVAAARAGDADAWGALLARFRLPVYAYVFELVHHEQTALDIVQESFINAARHIGTLRDDDKFASWLFNIAHQKCIQHWRRKHPEQTALEPDDDAFVDLDPGPSNLLIRKEQEAQFFRLLDQLPLPQRAVLLLYFVEEFSLDEISRITDANLGTVKSRLHYARKAFKKLYEENQ